MATKILIPTPLRTYTAMQETIEVEGGTVGELLSNMTSKYTELRKHLFTEDGKLRNFVNIYVNDDDIRYLDKEETPVSSDDTVSIVPSVAGGRS